MEFQVIAVGILIAFYGCYFAKMLHQKTKGIQTDQIGKGKVGFVRFVEVTLKVATIFIVIIEVFSIFFNTSLFPSSIRYVGVVFGVLGVLVFVLAVLNMRENWRAGVSKTDKTELVTSGIYQISRNPAFLGFDFVYIGILLMFFNWILFCGTMFAVLMMHLQIVNVEEDFLLDAFGDDYRQYKKKVCRYLGRR